MSAEISPFKRHDAARANCFRFQDAVFQAKACLFRRRSSAEMVQVVAVVVAVQKDSFAAVVVVVVAEMGSFEMDFVA